MLFTAKLVEDRPAGKIMIGIAVTGIAFIFLTMLIPDLSHLVSFFFSTLLVSVGVMFVISNGDLSNYKLENDLMIFTDSMQISQIIFPFKDVTELAFDFQSYQKVEAIYEHGGEKRKSYSSFGLGNKLSFVYKNQSFRYQFHLHSPQHYVAFVKMLEVLYEYGITFSEKNLDGQTFLMRNVNEEQLLLLQGQYRKAE